MYTELEDEFGDVVGKARRGQELTVTEVAASVGLDAGALARIEAYESTPEVAVVGRLATCLGLHEDKLQRSAAKGYFPETPAGRDASDLEVRMLVLGTGFLMNGYVVVCRETRQAVIIDPGFQAEIILAAVAEVGAEVTQVLLTHGHGDHVGEVAVVLDTTGAVAAIGAADLALAGAAAGRIEGRLRPGDTVPVGRQQLRVVSTPGHTPGGVSLVHDEMAFVGDALFAGSLGGTRNRDDYECQRRAVASEVLALPLQTILYPGHGPATSVAAERDNNPFFD